jgi:hypothetical protein
MAMTPTKHIVEVYADFGTQVCQGAVTAGFAFLGFAVLMFVLVLIFVPAEDLSQQITAPVQTTVFSLLLIGCYPIYRIRYRKTLAPRVRALLEGVRVEGIIETIHGTDEIVSVRPESDRVSANPLMRTVQIGVKKKISYRYTIDGREIRRTTIPFAESLLRGRGVGDSIPVYVSRSEPELGEADIFGIREP